MPDTITHDRLSRRERWAIGLLLLAFVSFGVLVEKRSAFSERRMGDLGCYLRAAWAVRTERNLYDIVDDNIWHYNYPPLYAILMMPLADPPRDADASGYLPYAVSVGICYVFNVLCLVLAVHWLASALEKAARIDQTGLRWSRRWWLLRTTPVLFCLTTIGHTLNRGQVNILVLMLISGLIAGLMTGRRFAAGLCLAAAICVKVFPAFLILVPLWRRDGRCLTGCAAGLLIGLLLIPAGVMGPRRTVVAYHDYARVLLGPALGLSDDQSREDELIAPTTTDNSSFQSVIQATLHPDRETRPRQTTLAVRGAAFGLAALMTLMTLWAARGQRARTGPGLALFVGCLTIVMVLLSPVGHSHYFVLELPLVSGLLALAWQRRPRLNGPYLGSTENSPIDVRMLVLFMILLVGNVLPHVPKLFMLRDRGLPAVSAVVLWFVSWWTLARQPAERANEVTQPDVPRLAA